MGITHLEIHTGLTKQFRAQAVVPSDPEPETGDVYVDNTSGSEAIGIFIVNSWSFLNLTK
jgi:hypothetical protein